MQPAVNLRLHLRGLVTSIRRILAVSIGREAGLVVMSRCREHCRRSRQANISHIPVQLPLSVLASSFGYIRGCRKIARCQNKGCMQSTASHPLWVSHGRVAVAMHMVDGWDRVLVVQRLMECFTSPGKAPPHVTWAASVNVDI